MGWVYYEILGMPPCLLPFNFFKLLENEVVLKEYEFGLMHTIKAPNRLSGGASILTLGAQDQKENCC